VTGKAAPPTPRELGAIHHLMLEAQDELFTIQRHGLTYLTAALAELVNERLPRLYQWAYQAWLEDSPPAYQARLEDSYSAPRPEQ
jgi:hypothetical protein